MTYYRLFNPAKLDESIHYPLFHCLPYVDTFFTTLQQANAKKLQSFPDAIIIECDWDTPKIYKDITSGKTWKYNGTKYVSSTAQLC